jgi:hypothetical protein
MTLACHGARPPAAAPPREDVKAARVLARYLGELFAERYAPADLKARTIGWDLRREIAALEEPIARGASRGELVSAFRRFFQSTHDLHTAINVDDERATWLGIHVIETDAGLRVAWIDPKLAPAIPLAIGDEITRFDGKSAADAVRAIAEQDGYRATTELDRAFADWFLTLRAASDLPAIPRVGDRVALRVRRGGGGAGIDVSLPWRDPAKEKPSERCPFWPKTRRSVLPPPGPVVWRSDASARFDAFVFEARGRRWGFLRLHTYDVPKDAQAAAVREVDAAFDAFIAHDVAGLVLDERGNGGGNFLLGYVMLARLSARPIVPTRQRFLVRGDAIVGLGARDQVVALGDALAAAGTDDEARAALDADPLFSGYFGFGPRDLATARSGAEFYRFFAGGREGLTEPHYALVKEVAPRGRTLGKRVVMLIDGEDISAADYVPATLHDDGHVVLFGENTSGAGGDARHIGLEDACTETTRRRLFVPCAPAEVVAALRTLGVTGFSWTVTLGVRAGGRLIENLGVAPDVPYRISAEDLVTDFAPMRTRILDVLEAR